MSSQSAVFFVTRTPPLALQVISDGAVQVHKGITHRFSLENTADALSVRRIDPTAAKAVVSTIRG